MNVLHIFLTVHLHKMCINICVVGCLHTFLCACVCMHVYVCLIVSVCEYLFTCIFICLCIDENQLRTKRKQDLKCISTRTWLYQLKGMSWVSALKNNDLMVQHMITNIHENIYSTYQWKTLRISDHLRRQWTQNCKLDKHLVKKISLNICCHNTPDKRTFSAP